MERRGRLVKDRPGGRLHVEAAGCAGPSLAALSRVVALERALDLTALADRMFSISRAAVPPKPFQAGVIVRELAHELHERVGRLRGGGTFGVFPIYGWHRFIPL